MIKRSLYYWSKMYEGQLTKGQDYDTLSRIKTMTLYQEQFV